MLCNKVTGSVQGPQETVVIMYHFGVNLAVSVSHPLWRGLLQLQRQIKYGCNFSLVGRKVLLMDCLLVRVNNRLSRTSAISNTADVLILSNVPVYM